MTRELGKEGVRSQVGIEIAQAGGGAERLKVRRLKRAEMLAPRQLDIAMEIAAGMISRACSGIGGRQVAAPWPLLHIILLEEPDLPAGVVVLRDRNRRRPPDPENETADLSRIAGIGRDA